MYGGVNTRNMGLQTICFFQEAIETLEFYRGGGANPRSDLQILQTRVHH